MIPTHDETPEPQAAVWLEIVRQARVNRRVTVRVDMLTESTSLLLADVETALEELGEVGLIATWHDGKATVATLTSLAAFRLKLRLRRQDRGWRGLAWEPLGSPERRQFAGGNRAGSETDLETNLDHTAGSEPAPELQAIATETLLKMAPRPGRKMSDEQADLNRLPWPSVVLMGGSEAWLGIPADGLCPVCNGKPLPPSTVCGRCLRWGLDWLLAKGLKQEATAEREGKSIRPAKRPSFRQSWKKSQEKKRVTHV